MSGFGATKSWFSAQELAALRLPGLPTVKRKVNERAAEDRWAIRVGADGRPMARPRPGRGGGLEYNIAVLPPPAVAELVRRGLVAAVAANDGPGGCPTSAVAAPQRPHEQIWDWFERQPAKVKAEAAARLNAVAIVEMLEAAGFTRTAAVAQAAAKQKVSTATLWNWLQLIQGVDRAHRLPRLAPQRRGGGREADLDDDLWQVFKSDYLRPEKPTAASCYARLQAYAARSGRALPHLKTLQRRIDSKVDGRLVIAKREGAEALRRTLPPQQRTVAGMHALELVNIDGHKWDVFCRWPDGHIGRPMMVAIQDIYSRKFLAWRIGQTESAQLTRLAFADLFKTWGIPDGCLLDNGRAFASKEITGGARTRFRFKIRPSDPSGLLTSMGVHIHWATPYRGQSKPIERGFRDLCDHGAKHPAFAGAYTGNRPDAKPENYGERAVDIDVFTRLAGQIMAAHNARLGRRTETARGRSFDQAFAESYAQHPIRRATATQQRLALLVAEQVSTERLTGSISLYDNRFWAEALHALAGERVIVRFDPDDLASEVHVYRLDDSFVCTAPILERTGFLDRDSAKASARRAADLRRHTRKAEALQDLISAEQLAALLPDDDGQDEPPQPSVVRPVRMVRTAGGAAARRSALDRLDFEDLATAVEHRSPLRLVE